jgi:hypothetical protein
MDLFKNLFKELNKRGVSATVITIILLVVGLAILLVIVIGLGQSGGESIKGISDSLDTIKSGGTI